MIPPSYCIKATTTKVGKEAKLISEGEKKTKKATTTTRSTEEVDDGGGGAGGLVFLPNHKLNGDYKIKICLNYCMRFQGQSQKEPIKYTTLVARPCENSVLSVDRAGMQYTRCKGNAIFAYGLHLAKSQRKERTPYSIGEDRE